MSKSSLELPFINTLDFLGYKPCYPHGGPGTGWHGTGFSNAELAATRKMLLSKGFLIAGGSSEVQLNIIAKRVLGLPD